MNKSKNSRIIPQSLAYYWPQFVDCTKRLQTEAPFMLKIINNYKGGTIYDVALGVGCESIFLIENEFKVISNEIDPILLEIANKMAKKKNIKLNVTKYDWRTLENRVPKESVDVIILMGNSLCLLENITEIKKCIKNFFQLLKINGCFLVDERNFRYILSEKEEILKGNFMYSFKYIYCGTEVTGRPIEISNQNVRFGYFYKKKGLIATLDMYPFKEGEIIFFLKEAGFKEIKLFSDYKEELNLKSDYFTYLAVKN